MERRSRALHRFLAASPIVLLIAVGLVGHYRKPPYPHPAGGADYNRRVLAYAPRVKAVQDIDPSGSPTVTPEEVAEARAWAEGFASGELQPLVRAVYEDHLRDGARGEALRAGLGLAADLSFDSERAIEAGKPTAAAVDEALLAAEVGHGLRTFEIQAFIRGLLIVRRGLTVVEKAWPALSPTVKARLRPRIEALRVEEGEVDEMATKERVILQDYLERQQLRTLPSGLESGPTGPEVEAARRGAKASNAKVQALLDDDPSAMKAPLTRNLGAKTQQP